MAFETLTSDTVYRGRVFSVRADRVRLPGGRETRLDIIDHANSVVVIPLDDRGDILFVRQYRHAARRELLELPAGTLNASEDPLLCAGRELREETGQAARELTVIGGFFLAPGYSTEYMHVFRAENLHSDPLPGDEDEILSLERLSSTESRRMLAVGSFEDAKTVAALAMFFAR